MAWITKTGIDLRQTLAYVTDPTGCGALVSTSSTSISGYSGSFSPGPLTINGNTFSCGWVVTSTGVTTGNIDGARNRSTSVDARCAGNQSPGGANPLSIKIQAGAAAGQYKLWLAIGDATNAVPAGRIASLTVRDSNGTLFTVSLPNGWSSGHVVDAAGNLTTIASWATTTDTSGVGVTFTTSDTSNGNGGPFIFIDNGAGSGGSVGVPIAHIALQFLGGIPLTAQTVSSSTGQIGTNVAAPQTQQTATYTIGTVAPTLSPSLTAQTVSINEGLIFTALPLVGQTITSAEGTLSPLINNDVTTSLSAQSAQFQEGTLADNISYILDQNQVILVGQDISLSQGTLAPSVSPALTAQTLASTEGTLTQSLATALAAQNIVSVEGTISTQAGNNVTNTLASQNIAAGMGVLGLEADYFPTAETITSVQGVLNFSNTGAFTVQLGSQIVVLTEGVFGLTVPPPPPPGTGPPLFIPPQLGKPVTTRTFSWGEMASRAWGSEFRAPDHRIYQFSGGNYKDSTDMGTTGIYSPNLGTPDNPPQQ